MAVRVDEQQTWAVKPDQFWTLVMRVDEFPTCLLGVHEYNEVQTHWFLEVMKLKSICLVVELKHLVMGV